MKDTIDYVNVKRIPTNFNLNNCGFIAKLYVENKCLRWNEIDLFETKRPITKISKDTFMTFYYKFNKCIGMFDNIHNNCLHNKLNYHKLTYEGGITINFKTTMLNDNLSYHLCDATKRHEKKFIDTLKNTKDCWICVFKQGFILNFYKVNKVPICDEVVIGYDEGFSYDTKTRAFQTMTPSSVFVDEFIVVDKENCNNINEILKNLKTYL